MSTLLSNYNVEKGYIISFERNTILELSKGGAVVKVEFL